MLQQTFAHHTIVCQLRTQETLLDEIRRQRFPNLEQARSIAICATKSSMPAPSQRVLALQSFLGGGYTASELHGSGYVYQLTFLLP